MLGKQGNTPREGWEWLGGNPAPVVVLLLI